MKGLIHRKMNLAFVGICLMVLTCAKPVSDNASGTGFELLAGSERWLTELRTLKNPRGVLPTGTDFAATNIRNDAWGTSYEFFAYDDTVVLLLLSNSPLYFIKIETKDFQYHLQNELKQLNDPAVTPANKLLNTITFYKQVGDHSVEVYFTPSELNFVSSGANIDRIGDKNSTTYPELDLWKLYEAAGDVVFYTPSFDNQKIADDFYAHFKEGKRRLILADSTTITNPANSNSTSYGLNFSFMLGTNLSITDHLLGSEDIRFVDRYKLTRDFAAFFSVPVNNGATGLSQNHGIAVVIRGDMKHVRAFIAAQGVDVNKTPVTVADPGVAVSTLNAGDLVISEVHYDVATAAGFEGGAASPACDESNDEFVEIYNKTGNTVNLTGATIQYITSTPSVSIKHTFSGKSIAPNDYIVVVNSVSAGCYTSSNLPAGKFVALSTSPGGSGYMSASGATIVLAKDNTLVNVTAPSDLYGLNTNVLDFVGWASPTAKFWEGGTASVDCTDLSIIRKTGVQDTGVNGTDFQCGIGNGTPGRAESAPDTTPPTVSSTAPADNTTGIATNATIIVTFNEAMSTGTITGQTNTTCTGSIRVSSDNFVTCIAMTSATPVFSGGNTIATLTPATSLSASTTYKIRVTTAVQDAASNALATQFTTGTGFTTGVDTTAPTVTSTTPADAVNGIAAGTTIAVTFSEAMSTGTITGQTNTTCTGSIRVSSDNFVSCIAMTSATPAFSGGNSIATLTPASALALGTTFKIRVTTGAQDVAGNPLTGVFTTATGFTTAASSNTIANHVVIAELSVQSAAGATDEYVKLYNPTASPISLANYGVWRSTAGSSTSTIFHCITAGTIPAYGYFLIGGSGYTAATYGGLAADVIASSSPWAATGQKIMLSAGGAMIDAWAVDGSTAVTVFGVTNVTSGGCMIPAGTISGTALSNPSWSNTNAVERKACLSSTGDANASTGIMVGGGHSGKGNGQDTDTAADLTVIATKNPQSSLSTVEASNTCP